MENIDLYPNNDLEELDELNEEKEEGLDDFGEKDYLEEEDDGVVMDPFDDRDDF